MKFALLLLVNMNRVSIVFRSNRLGLLSLVLLFQLEGTSVAQTEEQSQLFEITATKYMLGTQIDFKAMCTEILSGKKAFYYAYQEIARIEDLFSSHKPSSQISKINQMAGLSSVKVSYETLAIVQRSVAYSKRFNGIFDISIGPITELWGFNSDREVDLPQPENLNKLLALVNYKYIAIDEADTTVFLKRKGMKLDLGGIAKGYAIDRAAAVLKNKGLHHFLINAGGDIYACGFKMRKESWLVGIQHPRTPQALLATAKVHDQAVATSGDYERYTIINGKRYCHIMDPKTGYPANACQSVTVFASSAEEADAWATFLFVIGRNADVQNPSIESVIVDASGKMHYNPWLKQMYEFTPVN